MESGFGPKSQTPESPWDRNFLILLVTRIWRIFFMFFVCFVPSKLWFENTSNEFLQGNQLLIQYIPPSFHSCSFADACGWLKKPWSLVSRMSSLTPDHSSRCSLCQVQCKADGEDLGHSPLPTPHPDPRSLHPPFTAQGTGTALKWFPGCFTVGGRAGIQAQEVGWGRGGGEHAIGNWCHTAPRLKLPFESSKGKSEHVHQQRLHLLRKTGTITACAGVQRQ